MRVVEGIRALFHAISMRPSVVLCVLLMVLVAHASVAEDVPEEEDDWPPPDHEMLFETDACREELQKGRELLSEVVVGLSNHEQTRQSRAWNELYEKTLRGPFPELQLRFSDESVDAAADPPSQCPAPNATLFPPPPTPSTTTTKKPAPPPPHHSEEFVVPSIYRGVEPKSEQQYEDEARDPYSNLMRRYYANLIDDEAVCNGPSFTDLNSVTEEQLHGLLTTLAVHHAKPLCPICQAMVQEVAQALAGGIGKNEFG
ncbi:hypothetical protein AAVH_39896, partial [Aphelenchoides avenae]